jgi:hypothetical protein
MPARAAKRKNAELDAAKIEKLFYSRQEAAFALAIPLRSIDYMIADQRLNTRRYGRRVLIPAADIRRTADKILRCDMLPMTATHTV